MRLVDQYRQMKEEAKAGQVMKEWKDCLSYLSHYPLSGWVTDLFEVQAMARKEGFNVRTHGSKYMIEVPD